MSSPSKRSARLSKQDQAQNKTSPDKKKGHVTKLKMSGDEKIHTPAKKVEANDPLKVKDGNQHSKFVSDAEALVPETTTVKGSSKKTKTPQVPPTPPSAVRRSGRAPVPSSRYKDMEVEITGIQRKRSIASVNTSGEPVTEQEPSKKPLKSQSKKTKTGLSSTLKSDDEEEMQATKSKQELNASTAVKKSKQESISPTEKSHGENLSTHKSQTVLVEMTEDEAYSAPTDAQLGDKSSISQNKTDPESDEEGNAPISVEEMIERSLQEGKIDKSDLEASSSVRETDSQDTVTETTEPEVCQEEPPKTAAIPQIGVEEDQSASPASLTIGAQQVTFTEKDGETVAIVTIPPGLGDPNNQIVPVSPREEFAAGEKPDSQHLTEVVSVIPNSQGGHTVVAKEVEETLAVDGSHKVTLEARRFSTLLKPKTRAANPVTGHGRVIPRNEQQMISKGGIANPSLMPPMSFGSVSSSQNPPSQKGSLTYSLLPTLQQIPAADTTAGSTHGSVASKGNQKVIIVNQKASDKTQSLAQAEVVGPKPGSSSTVIHVKKTPGSTLTAYDLECVLKAISGGGPSSSETDQTAEVPSLPPAEEKESETASALLTRDAETTDLPSAVPENQEVDASPDKLEKDVESLSQESTSGERNASAADDPVEKTDELENEGKVNTMKEHVKGEEETEPVSLEAAVETPTEETPSEALPVESALYQALQALEPQNITEEQTAQQEAGGATSDLAVAEAGGDESKALAADKWKVKGESIKVVDNGIEYDVRIVCQDDVAEEIIDDSTDQEKTEKAITDITFKQEPTEEGMEDDSGMQTSGTQTLYNLDKGSTIQRMTTVVDKDGQKKQVYYVSVFPGKGVLNKVKSNQGARFTHASWVLSENGMYCCGKCNYKTDRKANFYKHRRLHIGTKPHVCPICQYKAGTSSNLKRHMGIHKDIREHKCEICGLCFRQKIHLERHVKYKHEVKSVHCPLCDYVCANEQPDLKMHMKRKHSSGKSGEVLTCPECHVEVGSKKDLKQHMKFHKDGPELKLFCKECSFVTDCQSRLRRHAAIHSKLKPFQCGVCNYRAAQKEHVLRHLRTQHKIEVKREVKKTWRSRKQPDQEETKEKADFTSGDKIFACNHCTMRFAKLINLYKHLHTQHSDIMPPETSGNYFCVVCEFSTTTKKNLLVHMRRHNMTDQSPPSHVYSCVLCRYVNPKRRNLFQHMRKKHNIDICTQGDDDTETQVIEMGDVIKSVKDGMLAPQTTGIAAGTSTGEVLETVDMNENSTSNPNELGTLASMIKIEDLTRTGSTPTEEAADGLTTLVIDTHAGESGQITQTTSTSTLIHQQQHSVEALEGLQALAEQAGLIDNVIEEQVHSVPALEHSQQTQTIIIDQAGSVENGEGTESVVEIVNGSVQFDELPEGAVVGLDGKQEPVEIDAAVEGAGMELSEDQLSSLRHGDMVEMDGDLYIVEMSQDPDQPSKQILSFVPVSATDVTDQ